MVICQEFRAQKNEEFFGYERIKVILAVLGVGFSTLFSKIEKMGNF